jgi:hypothetical protein
VPKRTFGGFVGYGEFEDYEANNGVCTEQQFVAMKRRARVRRNFDGTSNAQQLMSPE